FVCKLIILRNVPCALLFFKSCKVVYTIKENCIDKNVNFDICVSGDKMILRPLEKSSEYVLFCQRVMSASVIKIEATEYFSKTEKDGSFTFYMENDKV
ncbi:MAG: hypothetical protein K1W41_14345, partial [Lachnospiraceae bacterium]